VCHRVSNMCSGYTEVLLAIRVINKYIILLRKVWLGYNETMGTRVAQWYRAGLWAGWLRVWILAGAGNFSLHHHVQAGSGFHPASYPMGTRGSFLGVKRPEHEVETTLPSNADVKNVWSYTSTPPIHLHLMMLTMRLYTNYLYTLRSHMTQSGERYCTVFSLNLVYPWNWLGKLKCV
jgi:hypothetical protein